MECLGTLLLLRVVGLDLVASVIECLRTLSFAMCLRTPPVCSDLCNRLLLSLLLLAISHFSSIFRLLVFCLSLEF